MASLYLHIPFCEHKCIYCDFYSIETIDPLERFLAALKKEITLVADTLRKEPMETVFFGGGTPSLLSPEQIKNLLDLLADTFTIAAGAEITLEANPGTVDEAKLAGYRSAGVNRLSFGVQSFFEDDLKFLTRIHSPAQAEEAVRAARRAGFDNVSIDLIFALPNQTEARWRHNLERAIDLETEHLSAYSLIVEAGTPLARMVRSRQVSPLPLAVEAEMYEITMRVLGAAGYEHYEVSNYARPGRRSRHNSNYWNHANYIGFGPSAHSFWADRRWWNIANLSSYCERLERGESPAAGSERLTPQQLLDESIMLGLRSGGIDTGRLRRELGADLLTRHGATIDALIAERLAERENDVLRLTDKGFLLCDEITEHLLMPASSGALAPGA